MNIRVVSTTLALLLALASFAACGPAAARSHHHSSHSGFYEGNRQYHIDRNDHASSPYAGGAG
jgi:hypothetical protein